MNDRDGPPGEPRFEDDVPRLSDDDGLEPGGDGLSPASMLDAYEGIAQRDDLARQLEDVIASARAWARASGGEEPHAIAEALADLYERLGPPTEASDRPPSGPD
jgi:hypothetical protein